MLSRITTVVICALFAFMTPTVAAATTKQTEESPTTVATDTTAKGADPSGQTPAIPTTDTGEINETQAYGITIDATRRPLAYTIGGSTRISGSNRYATAVETSKALNPDTGKTVVIASGISFPDALSVASGAANIGAPVLLTAPDHLSVETAAELTRLSPATILIAGGNGAVSPAVEQALSTVSGARVQRISGANRYATSAAICKTFWPSDGVPQAFIASGEDFPDALSGAAAAAHLDAPLLLMGRHGISPEIAIELHRLAPQKVIVLGKGFSAEAQASVRAVIDAYATAQTDREITIVGGANRFETSVAIANTFFGGVAPAVLASGMNFPDALVAVPLAKAAGAPIILAETDVCTAPTDRLAAYARMNPRVVLGGQSTIPDALFRADTSACKVALPELLGNINATGGEGLVGIGQGFNPGSPAGNRLHQALAAVRAAGDVSLVMIDINSGNGVAYNADHKIYAASTVKGPYVAAINKYHPGGVDAAARHLMHAAITVSSNDAYTALRARYGANPMAALQNDAGGTTFRAASP